METLLDHLKTRIRQDGPLSVADYMAECLGNPKFGYYMNRDPFGKGGDFVTAPEVSQMFGELIGLWLVECWNLRGRPSQFLLLEMGPGRGTLMADILRAAKMMPEFLAAADIHLMETSPALRKIQRDRLKEHRVTWHGGLDSLPAGKPLFVVANELFDALPIHQLMMTDQGWRERLIGLDADSGNLVWGLAPGAPALAERLADGVQKDAVPGEIAEICPVGAGIARELGLRIQASGGAGLFIDYGYGASARGDSLQAMRKHKYCGILDHPGDADLTAHVDFEMLAGAFTANGASAAPLLTQGEFLNRLGLPVRAQTLGRGADADDIAKLQAAYDRLTGADQMGNLFKVLGVSDSGHPGLPGFDAG